MQQVGVHAERSLAAFVLGNRDLVLFGKLNQLGAAGQIPFPPRGDDLNIGVQRIGRQFKPHLVVALACGAMGHRIGALGHGDLDQAFGNQRPRNRGAQQIKALVNRIGAKHREDEIPHELFAHVFDVDRARAHHLGLGAGRFQLFALAQVGGKGHDLAAVFHLQPLENDRGIEPSGIGKNDLLRRRHDRTSVAGCSAGHSGFCGG